MSMKKLRLSLIIVAALLIGLLLFISRASLESIASSLSEVSINWWTLIAVAIAVQLVGHWLRMLRTKTIIDQAYKGAQADQFNALAVGYLFNALLPFRLGELLRAGIIAARLRMSFVYTFAVIVLERSIDVLVVGAIVVVVSFFFSGTVATTLLIGAVGGIILAGAIIFALILLERENAKLLSLTWKVTGWFNISLSNALRFKVWSLIFGLQQFRRNKSAMKRYAALAIASWGCYIISMAILAVPVLRHTGLSQKFVVATSPYVAVSAPAGPASESKYGQIMAPVTASLPETGPRNSFIVLSWLALVVPMSIVGIAALLWMRLEPARRPKPQGLDGFKNKLLRRHDLSQEFPAFLDSYFRGHDLSRILHKLELAGELSLVRFFKGGSDAITVLVLSNEKLFVKKIIPLKYEDRLKAQHDWLKKHKNLPNIVKLLGEQRTANYYAIDLAYNEENIPFFEHMHRSSLKDARAVLSEVWDSLHKSLHSKAQELQSYPDHRDKYIEKHIFGCVDKASAESSQLQNALKPKRIIINGKEYDNLYQVMEKIKANQKAWADLASYRYSGVVHGDPSIDNVLVSSRTGKPLIIDPAPDGNIIEGAVFDMGKMMQSFYCGYEFLFRDEDQVSLEGKNIINYRNHRSERYSRLCEFVQKELAPQYLNEAEQRALIFHAAALHLRRLKHQVHYCPANHLKFYAVGVKTLNDFLAQYE